MNQFVCYLVIVDYNPTVIEDVIFTVNVSLCVEVLTELNNIFIFFNNFININFDFHVQALSTTSYFGFRLFSSVSELNVSLIPGVIKIFAVQDVIVPRLF